MVWFLRSLCTISHSFSKYGFLNSPAASRSSSHWSYKRSNKVSKYEYVAARIDTTPHAFPFSNSLVLSAGSESGKGNQRHTSSPSSRPGHERVREIRTAFSRFFRKRSSCAGEGGTGALEAELEFASEEAPGSAVLVEDAISAEELVRADCGVLCTSASSPEEELARFDCGLLCTSVSSPLETTPSDEEPTASALAPFSLFGPEAKRRKGWWFVF